MPLLRPSVRAASFFEQVLAYAYGNSYLAAGTLIAQARYVNRVTSRLRMVGLFNSGVGGNLTHDTCSYAYGSFAQVNASGSSHAGTWTPTATVYGLVVLETVRNDAGWDGLSPTKARAGFVTALNSLVRLMRASSVVEDTDASFVYSGTWAGTTGNAYYGAGSVKTTTVNGASVTITTPVGTDFDLVLIGWDSTGGVTGSTFSYTVDGGSAHTGTTNDVVYTGHGVTPGACQLALGAGLHGLANAAHTIVLTHTGSAGQALAVDRLLVQSAHPPTVLIPKAAQLPSAGYANFTAASASWATDQVYNGLIGSYVAGFTDRSVVTVDPNPGWDSTSMISDGDGLSLHPNDLGMAHYADVIEATLRSLPVRDGLVLL